MFLVRAKERSSRRTLRAARLLRLLIVKRHANLFVPGIINISMYFVRINLCARDKTSGRARLTYTRPIKLFRCNTRQFCTREVSSNRDSLLRPRKQWRARRNCYYESPPPLSPEINTSMLFRERGRFLARSTQFLRIETCNMQQ